MAKFIAVFLGHFLWIFKNNQIYSRNFHSGPQNSRFGLIQDTQLFSKKWDIIKNSAVKLKINFTHFPSLEILFVKIDRLENFQDKFLRNRSQINRINFSYHQIFRIKFSVCNLILIWKKAPSLLLKFLDFHFLRIWIFYAENLARVATLTRVEKRICFGWFFGVVDLGLGKRNSAKNTFSKKPD